MTSPHMFDFKKYKESSWKKLLISYLLLGAGIPFSLFVTAGFFSDYLDLNKMMDDQQQTLVVGFMLALFSVAFFNLVRFGLAAFTKITS